MHLTNCRRVIELTVADVVRGTSVWTARATPIGQQGIERRRLEILWNGPTKLRRVRAYR
jgi:hypothetical protein